MRRYILAIDQGTTGTRTLLFDPNGKLCGHGYRTFRQHYPKPGWVEHDPEEIWDSLKLALKDLFSSSRLSANDIAGIGIANQRETTLLWDPRTGRHYHRAIVWQDRRTAPLLQALKKRGDTPRQIRRLTGLWCDPYFSASKIQWLLDRIPHLRGKAASGRVCFGTVDSFLLWRLTSGAVHATDWTNASRTMLFNIRTKKWDDALLRIFHVPRRILPEALPSRTVFGKTRGLGFLPDGIPITAVLGDQQSALFGQNCGERGEAKNTYGTGAFFMVQLGKNPVFSEKGFLTTLAVDQGGEVSYALEGSVFIAGAAVQWIRDGLGWIRKASETGEIARRFRRSHPDPHVLLVPAFAGLGAPYWAPEARGAFLGLTRGTTREEMITAALESIAVQVADLSRVLEGGIGRLSVLKVDGGASRNDYLMQFQADLLGREVVRPAFVEATALGCAKLAGLNLNFWKNKEVFHRVKMKIFKPRFTSSRRRALLKLWQEAVKRVL